MGIADSIRRFFKPTPEEKADKLQERIMNMYGQTSERCYHLEQLHDLGPELAPSRLIKRFTCRCDNGTVDADEKSMTQGLLVNLGEASVEPLKQFLRKNDKDFSWPFRTLQELVSADDLKAFIVELLDMIGPDYVRNPERKEQLILIVKSYTDEAIGKAVLPYLDDDNETIRFVAADAVITHGHDFSISALAARCSVEESVRVLTLIAEAFRAKEWPIAAELHEAVSAHLPAGFRLNSKGIIL